MANASLSKWEYLLSAGLKECEVYATGYSVPSSKTCDNTAPMPKVGMRLICSKIYLLFLPELLKIFPYYSLKYHLLFPNYSALTVRK